MEVLMDNPKSFQKIISNIEPNEKYESDAFIIRCVDDGTISIRSKCSGKIFFFYLISEFEKINEME